MAKTSGGVRGGGSAGSRKHTGPGYTQPIEGEAFARSAAQSSPQLEVRYVAVDKITSNEVSNPLSDSNAVKKWIKLQERDDRRDGVYEPDSYYIRAVNEIRKRR